MIFSFIRRRIFCILLLEMSVIPVNDVVREPGSSGLCRGPAVGLVALIILSSLVGSVLPWCRLNRAPAPAAEPGVAE